MFDERSGVAPAINYPKDDNSEESELGDKNELTEVQLKQDIEVAQDAVDRANDLVEKALLDETAEAHTAVQLLQQRRLEYEQAVEAYIDFLEKKLANQ